MNMLQAKTIVPNVVSIRDSLFEEVEILSESIGGKKYWYIKGIFMQSNIVNRNGRLYEKHILDEAVNQYNSAFVKKRRAVGELTHPDTTKVNIDRISHLVEDISIEGNYYIGKAKVLNTPCGKIAQALLEGGVQLAVSSRADGSTRERSDGVNVVNPGLILRAIDIVYDPSAPEAFIDGLMESNIYDQALMEGISTWDTTDPDVAIADQIRREIKKTSTKDLNEAYLQAWSKLMSSCING